MVLQKLTFVLGGASSGKSALAERLVAVHGGRRVYLATARAQDDEMRAKIAAHRAARGAGWEVWEEPLEIAPLLHDRGGGTVVLLDCATLWLSNLILAGRDPAAAEAELLAAIAAGPSPVVVVSNEVGQGIVPETALGRRFRAAQGRLNQALAVQAGLVVAVMAGLPLALKGTLPDAIAAGPA